MGVSLVKNYIGNIVSLSVSFADFKKYMNKKTTLREVVQRVMKDINAKGIDVISDKISGPFAWFRALELAFTLNHL